MLLEVSVGRCGIVVYVLYKSPVPLHDTHTHTHIHNIHTQIGWGQRGNPELYTEQPHIVHV